MIGREIPITFLESPDIVFSLVPDQDWYLKVDQISPTLLFNNEKGCLDMLASNSKGKAKPVTIFLTGFLLSDYSKRTVSDILRKVRISLLYYSGT